MKHLADPFLAGLVALLVACVPPDERSYSTDEFEIHTDFSAPLCAGDLDRWVAFVDHTEDLLDTQLRPGLDVYIWDEVEWTSDPWCAARTQGCYAPGRHAIYAALPAVQHELVHAVAESRGSRNMFFNEGVATAFSGSATSFGWSAPTDNIGRGSRAVDRRTASHFTRWLWETRAHTLLLDLLDSKANAKAFEQIYGQSLAEAEQQYFVEAPWSYPPLFFHATPAITDLDTDYWQETVDFDCERADVYGRPGGTATIRRLEIAELGVYALWTDADGLTISRRQHDIVVDMAEAQELTRGDVPADFVAWYPGHGVHEVELNAGEYELWITDLDADLDMATAAIWTHLGPTPTSPTGTL